ncbi:MAG: hypothetical protein ACYC26_15960 [Phycisphaerales bacterium]
MNAQDLQQHLYDLLAAITIADFTDDQQIPVPYPLLDYQTGIDCVSTFAEAGIPPEVGDTGVVVRMKDGREFNIAITRSK